MLIGVISGIKASKLQTTPEFLHGLSPQVVGRDDEKSHLVYTREVFLDGLGVLSACEAGGWDLLRSGCRRFNSIKEKK